MSPLTPLKPFLATLAVAALLMAACSKESAPRSAPAPDVTARSSRSGTAVTGGGQAALPEPTPPAEVAAKSARREAVREAVAMDSGLAAVDRLGDDATLATLALDVAPDGASYTGALTVDVVAGERLGELVFALPANVGAGADRPLRVDRVTLGGAPVEPRGSASLLRVPVEMGAGDVARVEITFSGAIPALAERDFGIGPEDLQRAAGLLAVDPPGAASTGRRGGLTLLARAYPVLVPPGTAVAETANAADLGRYELAHYSVEVSASDDLTVLASGVEVARERVADGRRRTRFVAPAAREVAVVLGTELSERSEKAGDVDVVVAARPAGDAAARTVVTAARRAIETYELRLGRFPRGRLTVVEGPLSAGAAVAFPGLVVVDSLFFAPPTPMDAGEPVLAVLTRHPALREGLEYAVAHAVAHSYWGDLVATDAARAPWVDEALASVAALRYFGDAGAGRAERRQRELFLALPYQVARSTGAPDLPVRTPAVRFRSALDAAAIHHGKAALWLDATRRRVSDTIYDEALRALVTEHAWGELDDGALVARLAKGAPRPQEVRDLARRWLDETHGDEDIGSLRPDLLAEYLVTDGVVQGGARELLGLLAKNDQVKQLIGELMAPGPDGEVSLDGVKLMGVMAQMLGEDAPPEMKRWLDVLAKAGAGGPPSSWGPEVVKSLAGQLGLDPNEQKLVEGLSGLLFQALDDSADGDDAPGDDGDVDPAPPE